MATWVPISGTAIQYAKNASGAAAVDYYLKFYAAGTTTAISMATTSSGGTTLDKCKIDATGWAVNGSDDPFIPHIDRDYKLVLYTNSADADSNATGSAAWVIDNLSAEGLDKSYTSVASLRDSTGNDTFNVIEIESYYEITYPSTAGPKGGHKRHRTGGTNAAPTVGSPVAVSTIGTGTQAGYVWDGDGVEWFLSFKDRVDVLQTGAVGDGVTDDTTPITDAVTLVTLTGGTVFAPKGVYLVSGSGVYVPSGVTLEGDGYDRYTDKGTVLKRTSLSGTITHIVHAYGTAFQLKNFKLDGSSMPSTGRGLLLLGESDGSQVAQYFGIENVYIYGDINTTNDIANYGLYAYSTSAIYYGRINGLEIEACGTGMRCYGQYNANMHANVIIKSCHRHLSMDGLSASGCIENVFSSIGFFGAGGDSAFFGGGATALELRNGARLNTFVFSSETSSGGQTFDVDTASENNTYIGYSNESTKNWVPGWLNDPINSSDIIYNKRGAGTPEQSQSVAGRSVFDTRFGMGAASTDYEMLAFPSQWAYNSAYTAICTLSIAITRGGGNAPIYGKVVFGVGKIPTASAITVTPISKDLSADFITNVDDILFAARSGETAVLIFRTSSSWAGGSAPTFSYSIEYEYSNVNYASVGDIEPVGESFVTLPAADAADVAAGSTVLV